jgi:hypothetical protein
MNSNTPCSVCEGNGHGCQLHNKYGNCAGREDCPHCSGTGIEPTAGIVGSLYGVNVAHQQNVGETRPHDDKPEACWCWLEPKTPSTTELDDLYYTYCGGISRSHGLFPGSDQERHMAAFHADIQALILEAQITALKEHEWVYDDNITKGQVYRELIKQLKTLEDRLTALTQKGTKK